MKTRTILIVVLFLAIFATKSHAQITMEMQYGNVIVPDELTIVHLSLSGDKIVKVDRFTSTDAKVFIYNIDYSLWKVIDLSPFIENNVNVATQYTSENLFSTDGKVCLLLYCNGGTKIINEDGQLLLAAPGFAPQSTSDSPAIFHTSVGVKMRLIASDGGGGARIYVLPGVSVPVTEIENSDKGTMNIFPNPTSGSATINYQLPNGVASGEIVLCNNSGQQLKVYQVNKTSNDLQISTLELAAGTYFWQLQAGTLRTTKKMIVLK